MSKYYVMIEYRILFVRKEPIEADSEDEALNIADMEIIMGQNKDKWIQEDRDWNHGRAELESPKVKKDWERYR